MKEENILRSYIPSDTVFYEAWDIIEADNRVIKKFL